MRYLLAVSFLLGLSALAASPPATSVAEPICAHSASTAKIGLAVLYTAEKAYYVENNAYGQNLLEIGAEPDHDSCDTKYWTLKAYVRKSGAAFTGISTSLLTGETWVINERKELKQVRKPSSELPKAHVPESPK